MALAVPDGGSPAVLMDQLLEFCQELVPLVKEPLQVPERAKTALDEATKAKRSESPDIALKMALDALFEVSPLYKDLIVKHSSLRHSRDKAVKVAGKASNLFKVKDDA